MGNLMIDENVTQSERLIHTPSSFARKNLYYAQETGRLKSLREHVCIRENMESYLFFTVLDGRGIVSTGGKCYEARKGDAVLLDCRKHYEHKSDVAEPWEIQWVHFNGSAIASLFEVFTEGNVGNPVFTPGRSSKYAQLLDELNKALENNNVIAEINQSVIMERLLLQCLNDVVDGRDLSFDNMDEMEEDTFEALRESVNEHMSEDNLERILAIQYGLQPEALSELFQKKYGISLGDYILNRKLNKAKELLRFTIKSIDEIVAESGIDDEESLRKMLQESDNITLEDYRKKWAQWIKG